MLAYYLQRGRPATFEGARGRRAQAALLKPHASGSRVGKAVMVTKTPGASQAIRASGTTASKRPHFQFYECARPVFLRYITVDN